MVRTVGILFVSVLCLAACGSQDGPPVSSGQTGEPSASAPPECEAKGGVAIDDYAENATGERSPMEAAASYQRPGGPVPSPVISVTSWAMVTLSPEVRRRGSPKGVDDGWMTRQRWAGR